MKALAPAASTVAKLLFLMSLSAACLAPERMLQAIDKLVQKPIGARIAQFATRSSGSIRPTPRAKSEQRLHAMVGGQ